MESWYDSATGAYMLNESDVPMNEVLAALPGAAADRIHDGNILNVMTAWVQNTQVANRQGTIFDRDKYVTPTKIMDQFHVADMAVESDDVVGGVADITEHLAFSKVTFEADDEDEQDIWNQIAKQIDLDSRLREMWRELFTFSQFYCAIYWGKKSFKVRGKTKSGNEKRRTFDNLRVPLAVSLLDPRKVVPIGTFMFNRESLIYLADEMERQMFDRVLDGSYDDPIVQQLILSRYEMDSNQQYNFFKELGIVGSSSRSGIAAMYILNPNTVFRHTLTRPQYRQFSSVRMKSVFELLDLKNQLKEMDRAHLLGGTNFIVLITKGTDQRPATPGEITSLTNSVRVAARVPVIVGDHRLDVKIVTPSQDMTLDQAKYDLVDSRISARLLQMFVNPTGRNEDSAKLARVIAQGIESRRHMLRRKIEANIIDAIIDANESLKNEPDLRFQPNRISLDFDNNLATFLADLRDRREISRDTLLSEFDYDQSHEARKLEIEAERYDKIFQTQVPYNGVDPNVQPDPNAQDPNAQRATDPKAAGRAGGGNKNGGGAAKANPNRGKTKEQQA